MELKMFNIEKITPHFIEIEKEEEDDYDDDVDYDDEEDFGDVKYLSRYLIITGSEETQQKILGFLNQKNYQIKNFGELQANEFWFDAQKYAENQEFEIVDMFDYLRENIEETFPELGFGSAITSPTDICICIKTEMQ